MKPLQRILLAMAVLLGLPWLVTPARAQTLPLQLDQTALLVNTNYAFGLNWQSGNGVPLSTTVGNPPGSDGLAPTVSQQAANGLTTLQPTTNQFVGFVGASYVPVQGTTNLDTHISFAANANNLKWPRGTSDGTPTGPIVVVLRSAQVGAPYFAQNVSYYFGAVIPQPATDENGVALASGASLTYWLQQPYSTNNYTNAAYYWSPNARAVFAVQSGGVDITWEKAQPTNSAPSDYASNPTNYLVVAGFYYRLYTVHYVVSGAAVKTPQKMFWTEGSHAQTGHAVAVPQADVNVVNVVYNNNFPKYVTPGDLTTSIPVTNTLWFDTSVNEIQADNVEGRVFVELLGELNADGVTRRFLGYEIVDVSQEPAPFDITVNLGEAVPAYANGGDDSSLTPAPISNPGTSFYYQQQSLNTTHTTLWATHETKNLNDFQAYWLIQGVAGLEWPYLFDRYHEVWPTNATDYVNYLRPLVDTPDEAAVTAVQLPAAEAPSISYQDPLDQPRAFLDTDGHFYTFLSASYPAHRTLLQFLQGGQVSYERVFSWLDLGLKSNALLANSVATNLDAWNTNASDLSFADVAASPYLVTNTVNVGDRIEPPPGELGSAGNGYWAGYINQTNGTSFNPNDYLDPFQFGFQEANQGAIIPINAIPGSNSLEVWWFRSDNANSSLGFQPSYWPAVIGHYNIQWPSGAPEIILANNAGSGPLDSLRAAGTIYRQNDPTQPGYNPNEEHAVMLGGQAYALRDDLNVTNASGYTSDPYVLISYTGSDGLPSMSAFHVRREAPEEGYLFDYVVNAGTFLQAPMPLPLLNPPVEGSGAYATNYNTAPAGTAGDLPPGWTSAMTNGPFGLYGSFTFQDRQHNYWVYRGLNAGLPPLAAGAYNTNLNVFGPLSNATAVVGQPFAYYIHTSRQPISMTLSTFPTLPSGLSASVTTNGVAIIGTPLTSGSNTYALTIVDLADNSTVSNSLSLNIATNGTPVEQGTLLITSTNQYSGTTMTYTGRPPFLASPAAPSNSFTMRFYYKTQASFDWPGLANPPSVGSIVPYLLPKDANGNFVGNPANKTTPSVDIVYRPVWPSVVNAQPLPTLFSGQTLTVPINNLPAVRGQSSVQVLYQQSIATNNITNGYAGQSVVLYDPTVQKTSSLPAQSLSKLPASVVTTLFENKNYFPNLPPNLVNRLYFDPTTTNLVFQGQFVDSIVGTVPDYLMLNVLAGADLAAVEGLCPATDPNYAQWTNLVGNLSAPLYTFYQLTNVPGSYVDNPVLTVTNYAGDLMNITSDEQQVDSYAMSATGPGVGYVSFIVGNTINPAFGSQPVSVYIVRVAPPLFPGELKVIPDSNPLSESISFQHTGDLAGHSSDYLYDWRILPPVNGLPPTTDPTNWTPLISGNDITHYTLGGSQGIQSLGDNYVVMRYRDTNSSANPANTNWSPWTGPVLAPGYISRVVAGINPFNQTSTDLFDNPVNTTGTVIAEAGARWEGDVALNAQTLTNSGLIQIYETVLHQGENISINAGYNYGPANSALLLVTGYLNDLYNDVANDAWANAQNPTISIGTDNSTYGDLATSLFTFEGEEPSLLEQDLALLRGRDDSLSPGVQLAPVYNRLYWNYTLGINAGEVLYALNYNIQDQNGDGVVNAADAALLYPMGHGDAYGHYLTALTYYYQLLLNPNFDWVPQIEAVSVLGATVSVNYEDERKFASSAASLARTGEQIFDLTWREGYQPGTAAGWSSFGASSVNTSSAYNAGGQTAYVTKYWGLDHWATRTDMGAYLNWVVGNAILPPVDPDPTHHGIQKVDRTTVPELVELPQTAIKLQIDMDNAEAGFTPLNLSQNAIPFDINPLQVTGANPQTHFEQIYSRALVALNNAVDAFNTAQGVTQQLRQTQNSLSDFQASVTAQELAYNDQLIELYGTPYPNDMGPGQTYPQGYTGPDLIHYTYVENPDTNTFGGALPDPTQAQTYYLDIQQLPADWSTTMYTNFNYILESTAPGYTNGTAGYSVAFNIGPNGFFDKPATWKGQRGTIGSIQQAISTYLAALNSLRNDAANAVGDKQSLDKAMNAFIAQSNFMYQTTTIGNSNVNLSQTIAQLQEGYAIENQYEVVAEGVATDVASTLQNSIPTSFIAGVAAGGNFGKVAAGAIYGAAILVKDIVAGINAQQFSSMQSTVLGDQQSINNQSITIANAQMENDLQNAILALGAQEGSLSGDLATINSQLRTVSDAQAAYQALVAQGNRIQSERLTFRQHAAALIQGYRTSDQAFILFQNEDLQRYQTLFNLAAEYAFLAAQAYDYETGLLNTTQGKAFLNQIISSQAIGVVNHGIPQASASGGDPGLAGALAEMDADWQVLKGRLGFNNPDGYGTTVSLRTENYRILSGSDGDANWQQVLQQGQVPNLLADPDVERYCLQIDDGSGLPVPGIILNFSTVIANGLNLFGNQLSPGDHNFSPTSFATKIFSVGVDFDGYVGMDNPALNGGTTPPDPTLDPNGLAATPYVYLIPVGVDSMRSPPLGDASAIRTWNVDDVTIPLPFNIGGSGYSSQPFYTAASSLTEPLFAVRGNQAFRPVSSTSVFNTSIYGASGSLQPSQFTNQRLIGRSIWNSKWKLIIPGRTLLSDPNQGLARFMASVKDVHLYFITYSYAGN